ncbi:MAG: molybdopterin molybdotransferase MoeA [archaeon]|nr:molybdopterin molybdotransferase MoeA [archaeon]
MDVPYFVQVEEARRIAADVVRALPLPDVEHVPLAEAHGRLLGEDLRSLVDDPPFDNSAMDGFAMRLADVPEVPAALPVQAVVAAAAQEDLAPLLPGHAVRIMTGAPMPPGADAILPIEACEVSEGEVTLTKPVRPDFIRHQGENLAKGAVGLAAGVRLTPSRVGLCATMGHPTVPVQRRLRIAVIATGDELRSPGEPLLHGEVYESNSHGLVGLVRAMGHEALHRPVVHDTLDGLREALTSAAAEADMILTSGGVSMGEWDLVRRLMEEEGDLRYWRVKLRPGSPPLFGLWQGTPLFGLPGNPVSSHVVFRMLVADALRVWTGADGPKEAQVRVRLRDPVKATMDCLTLRRIVVAVEDGEMVGYQPRHQGSGNLESLASADALTLLEPGAAAEPGDVIDALLL